MAALSLEQQRAQFAWGCVKDGCTSDYKNLAKGAPALIMGNGLMQVLAFLEAKGKDHHAKLSSHVRGWLGLRLGGARLAPAMAAEFPRTKDKREPAFNDVMNALVSCDSSLFLRATEEALEILRWLRQLADAAPQAKGH